MCVYLETDRFVCEVKAKKKTWQKQRELFVCVALGEDFLNSARRHYHRHINEGLTGLGTKIL